MRTLGASTLCSEQVLSMRHQELLALAWESFSEPGILPTPETQAGRKQSMFRRFGMSSLPFRPCNLRIAKDVSSLCGSVVREALLGMPSLAIGTKLLTSQQTFGGNRTVTILIGNADNKLTQQEWSEFVESMRPRILPLKDKSHFFGGPNDARSFAKRVRGAGSGST